jgi:hypothetical protein
VLEGLILDKSRPNHTTVVPHAVGTVQNSVATCCATAAATVPWVGCSSNSPPDSNAFPTHSCQPPPAFEVPQHQAMVNIFRSCAPQYLIPATYHTLSADPDQSQGAMPAQRSSSVVPWPAEAASYQRQYGCVYDRPGSADVTATAETSAGQARSSTVPVVHEYLVPKRNSVVAALPAAHTPKQKTIYRTMHETHPATICFLSTLPDVSCGAAAAQP